MTFTKTRLALAAILATPFFARAQATAPTTSPDSGQTLSVRIAEVRGLVRVRNSPDEPWKKAAVGMELPPGAEFQTGPKSAVVCTIENDQTIVLDRLGVVSVNEAVKRAGTVKTDLLMKYGRTEYEIESAGAKHDATIRSPSSTLAVRGTRVNVYDQPPFAPSAQSYTGRAIYQYAKRQTAVGAPGQGAIVASDRETAANTALGGTVVDPSIRTARTRADARLIEIETSQGVFADFNGTTSLATPTGNGGPPSDEQLAKKLHGQLNIVARWTGDADLNLFVGHNSTAGTADAVSNKLATNFGSPYDETMLPQSSLNTSPTGGKIEFDHRGGATGGYEIASWTKPPTGLYGVNILPGNDVSDVRIQAFYKGKTLLFTTPVFDEQGNLVLDDAGKVVTENRFTIDGVVAPDQLDVSGFFSIPGLDELFPGDVNPQDSPVTLPGKGVAATDNRVAEQRAARKASLLADRESKATEKKQQIEQRQAEREQRRAAKNAPKLGDSSPKVQTGPFAMPKK